MSRKRGLWAESVTREIQHVMEEGKVRYPDDTWLQQSVEYHVNRAIVHLAWYGHDVEEDHLAHAFTRLMMACALERGYVEGAAGNVVKEVADATVDHE